jgi:hypothetical protein
VFGSITLLVYQVNNISILFLIISFFFLGLRKALYFQNLSVALMAVLVVIALYNQSSLPSYWMIIIQGYFIRIFLLICFINLNILGVLIGIGIIATLSSVACKVSISRDWIVALYGSDRQNLASRVF